MNGTKLVDVQGLAKTFKSDLLRRPLVALESLDLSVDEGEIFGFLGPNGAGKTTTIKILLGLIRPSSGSGSVLGRPFGSVESRRRIGFLPDSPHFYRYLSARELLRFAGRLHEIPSCEIDDRIEETFDRVGLQESARGRSLRTFSRGMLQRTGIGAAILHRPQLVILDEPMNGLDPLGRREFRDLILSLKKDGATVLLSSHVLSDIESTADRVGILNHGRLVQCGRLEEILADRGGRVEIRFDLAPCALLERLSRRLEHFRRGPGEWLGQLGNPHEASGVVREIVEAGGQLLSLQRHRVSLEEFFMRQVSLDCEARAPELDATARSATVEALDSAARNRAKTEKVRS